MKGLKEIAKQNNFKYVHVTEEEFQDGIGAMPGDNWIKEQVWYSTADMLSELGLPALKIQTGRFPASTSLDSAKQAMLDWLKQEKVTWYWVHELRHWADGTVHVAAMYGK